MGLKFLNKKGWHTGSLRNIENVWKAEQKNDAEVRKLDELRKQIHEEREKDEFRLLQEQAGLTPRQERLEFLYDSGLSVGKTISEGFKELETHPSDKEKGPAESTPSSSSSQQPTVPGALFEDKPQSANDAWRKLHSDPLLMIRQREREAMARIQNNPVKMAMIRKSMETKKKDDEVEDGERQKTNLKQKRRSSSKHHTESEDDSPVREENKKKEKHKRKERVENIDKGSRDQTRHHRRPRRDSESEDQQNRNSLRPKEDRYEEDSRGEKTRHHRHAHNDGDGEKQRHSSPSRQKTNRNEDDLQARNHRHAHIDHREGEKRRHGSPLREKADRREDEGSKRRYDNSSLPPRPESHKRKGKATQLSEEERAAKLREMEMDAEIHEEQRWKRLERAKEDDAREDRRSGSVKGSSFLDSMQKSVYGADKGGSSTIEESLRRRTHFRQGRSEADERNAFRR